MKEQNKLEFKMEGTELKKGLENRVVEFRFPVHACLVPGFVG